MIVSPAKDFIMPNTPVINSNPQSVPLQHELTMSILMTPDLANFTGNVHGGDLLKMLDQVAYACASRYSGTYVVTLSVDQVIFREPIHVGELVTFLASVNHVGHTSMEIGIRVQAENIQQRTIRHTNSCYFTMVAVDKNGKPTPVPPLPIKNDLQACRHEAAELRKQMRIKHHAIISGKASSEAMFNANVKNVSTSNTDRLND